ncbi:CRTAC1 family protein [Poritiphilus flavus]|uniref:ASPIC/UnbV domain-containing protein n=1 Tax=Poritiphilus flavus TaxID=2697053 RepID=A0A6L9E731_9FLAO|nr:CRTAC1 family protein [Poritiphilus flavus]NAS10526.1 hypothetical protein [Poritiphilus flavus]
MMRLLLLLMGFSVMATSQEAKLPFGKMHIDEIPQGSRGVSIADLDGNGLNDIVVANQVDSTKQLGNTIYFNHAEGYKRVAIADGKLDAWSESVHTVDVDKDGDLDLFFTTQFGTHNLLYLNNGSGHFSAADGGALTSDKTNSPGACWCDYDLDGDMDVFVVNREEEDDELYINNGKAEFKKAMNGPWKGQGGDGRACAWGDLNGDGMPDLYVVNFVRKTDGKVIGKHPNQLYWNTGNGSFKTATNSIVVEEENASYGVALVDFDYDHDLDIYVTNVASSDVNALYENTGDGTFGKLTDLAVSYQIKRPSKGQSWGDFNNDGWLDLYVANGTEGYPEIQNYLFLGTADHSFVRVYNSLPAIEAHISAGAASGDLDHDGDLDLYVCNWGGETEANDHYTNLHSSNGWIKLRLQGTVSNSFGIGSWISLTTDDQRTMTRYFIRETGYGSENAPEVHFGLGNATLIENIMVEWPSGESQTFRNLAPNAVYKIIEGKEIKRIDP